MRFSSQAFCKLVAQIGVASFLIAYSLYLVGVRVNTTQSISVGVYLKTYSPIKKGAYVFFCPPDKEVFSIAKDRNYISGGFCPGHYGYMMKKILAAKNDVITVNEKGVFVNGVLLPLSKQIKNDLSGALLPLYKVDNYTLKKNEILLMSDVSATSFDGRYFGLVNKSQIKDVIRPVLTW